MYSGAAHFTPWRDALPAGRPPVAHVPRIVAERLVKHWQVWHDAVQRQQAPPRVTAERPSGSLIDMQWDLGTTEIIAAVACAILITAVRYYLTDTLYKRWAAEWRAPAQYTMRLAENLWKFTYYVVAALFAAYVVLWRRPHLLTDPMHVWYEWHETLAIPWDIKLQYLLQSGFYLHSIYGTTFMDSRRKDYAVMYLHHVVTLVLMATSYATRQHLFGAMVLLCHDPNDIFLELWKWQSHLRQSDGGKHYRYYDTTSIAAFVAFFTGWFFTRLYLYPTTVLYAGFGAPLDQLTVHACRCLMVAYVMLLLLLVMNIYWWALMIVGIVRLALGNLVEVADIREYDNLSGRHTGGGGDKAAHGDGAPPSVHSGGECGYVKRRTINAQ